MSDSLGPGFRVGHWTDSRARTGCTVVLPPPGNVSACDVRGSAPSSRELELLHPDRRLTEIHAVLLTGGSAFGLGAADGVMSWLAERGVGYRTAVRPVPIVPAAVVFDLRSAGEVIPGPAEGRAACEAAIEEPVPTGTVGAGAGATVGKWLGQRHGSRGGVGLGRAARDGSFVGALAVVNSVGDVIADDGSVLAGSAAAHRPAPTPVVPLQDEVPSNTVLVVVATIASVDKREARWLAERGSDGVTVAVRPAHTRYDGDVTFAIAAPAPGPDRAADIDLLGQLATSAVAMAVRSAVAR